MKIRFCAALLLAALTFSIFTGCSVHALQQLDAAEDAIDRRLDAVENNIENRIEASFTETKSMYQSGYGYKKAGVIATKIGDENSVMRSLFEDRESLEREHRLTTVLDTINSTFGKGTIKLAVQGSGKIKSLSDNQSPHYTTLWSDIPTVTVK